MEETQDMVKGKHPTDSPYARYEISIAPEQLSYILAQGKLDAAKKIASQMTELLQMMKTLFGNQRFVKMENKKVWFDRNVSGLFPCFESVELPMFDTKLPQAATYRGLDFEGFHFDTMTEEECHETFQKGNGNPYIKADGSCRSFSNKAFCDPSHCNGYILTKEKEQGKSRVSNTLALAGEWWQDADVVTLVPICRLKKTNGGKMTFSESLVAWLEKGLVPKRMDSEQKKTYKLLLESYQVISRYLSAKKENISFHGEQFQEDVKKGIVQEVVFGYDFQKDRLAKDIIKGQKNYSGSLESIIKELVECDYKRANIEPYDRDRLTSPSQGHWELAEADREGMLTLKLPAGKYFIARPPQMDVMTSAVCAIDFGTKSTVVACRDKDERLLRIGAGDYSKAAELEDFENPTVIELLNLRDFLTAYHARPGRPFTGWRQVTVSHQAENALKNAKNSMVYYSVFSELKQWANDRERRLMLRDRHGNVIELKPYAELQEGDFDPIELYAYYLGLYINNMNRRIYLDYILSFPVTYGTKVRERIQKSFERGIRKSLPPALLEDDAMMRRFRVYAGASEPAAYAISALQEFCLEPKMDGEAVSYAVFDFGGGTTDYDFGVERIPKDHKWHFVIERYGRGGGDPHLGGENILSLLAYEVYKDNIATMRDNRIPIVLPPKGERFAADEVLVKETKDASQQAHMNLKQLAETLRPVWEQHEGYRRKFEERGNIKIPLFVANGDGEKETVDVEICVNLDHLQECIEKTIRAGIADFFTELKHTFAKHLESVPIHIFLAGNSCKSSVVEKLFREFMDKYEKDFADDIAEATSQKKEVSGLFELHLPLDMNSNMNIRKENDGEKSDENKPEEPREQFDLDKVRTGKTGVVFGLLRSRKGGRDVRIIERDLTEQKEIVFPYYLGDIDRENHFHVRIGREVRYGEWQQFVSADEDEFELYYTKEARSLDNQLAPHEVSMVRCLLDPEDVNGKLWIYICKVDADTIRYAVNVPGADFDTQPPRKIYTQSLR